MLKKSFQTAHDNHVGLEVDVVPVAMETEVTMPQPQEKKKGISYFLVSHMINLGMLLPKFFLL